MLEETEITRAIITDAVEEFLNSLEVDVVIGGGGPSGIVAARYLSDAGLSVALFEKKLSIGGGMWGGGMLYPRIVVQDDAKFILEQAGVRLKRWQDSDNYTANSIESVVKLTASAIDAGARIFNGITIEDVMVRQHSITGVVINSSAVMAAGLHVDPLSVASKFVIDATGHPLEICRVVESKGCRLRTKSGKIEGERPMWAQRAEELVVENTREIYPGLYVCGMAANAAYGAPRMGPVFGGMLRSGKRAAELIAERIEG